MPGTKSASKSANQVGVRVQFKTTGGIAHFPGLAKPTVIDSNQLNAEEAKKLTQLIEAADFFELPTKISTTSPGAADYRQYTITIEDQQKKHTVELTEPIQSVALQELITFLRAKGKKF